MVCLSQSYIKRFVWYNLYDSQSVFQFSLRLHHHTSCSYLVHKSCSYRVFSLLGFKQNDSKSSCKSSYYSTNFREKQVKEKEKKEESIWNLGLKEKKNSQYYETLLPALQLEDEYNYNILVQMTYENFGEIFQLIKED